LGFETPLTIVESNRYIVFLSLVHKMLDFFGVLIITCTTSDFRKDGNYG